MDGKKISDGSILIAHIADTHLRDSQYVTARRGLDFFDAFKQAVVESCKHADVLVLVGDIFDKSRPSPKVIGQLMQLDRILVSAGKSMLAVTGNHDWSDPTWLSTLFPDRLPDNGIIGYDMPGILPIDGRTVDFEGFKFVGIKPYGGVAFRQDLAAITVEARGADVVLYHGLVAGVVPFYAGQDPLRVDELPVAKNNKAWLLGDIHVPGYVEVDRPGGGKTLIGYPGSTEMCSMSEPTDKSIPLVRVSNDAATVESRLPLVIRPSISAEITTEKELDELVVRVTQVADDYPVVIAKFSRDLPQTINRLHSVLDAQRAVLRCYPLPGVKQVNKRASDSGEGSALTLDYFVANRFKDRPEIEATALALLHRGDVDASGIVAELIESRLSSTGVRETETV